MFMLLYAEVTEFVFHTMVTAGAAAFVAGLDTVFAEVLSADLAAAGTAQVKLSTNLTIRTRLQNRT